jgi:hypothetical protein
MRQMPAKSQSFEAAFDRSTNSRSRCRRLLAWHRAVDLATKTLNRYRGNARPDRCAPERNGCSNMTHDEKVQYLIKDLGQRGVGPYTAAPPLYRLLWRLGIETPPPHFGGFLMPALWMGATFGIIWGVFMWFTFWRGQMEPTTAVGTSVLAGCVFGAIMASCYRRQQKKLALPPWEDYPAAAPH